MTINSEKIRKQIEKLNALIGDEKTGIASDGLAVLEALKSTYPLVLHAEQAKVYAGALQSDLNKDNATYAWKSFEKAFEEAANSASQLLESAQKFDSRISAVAPTMNSLKAHKILSGYERRHGYLIWRCRLYLRSSSHLAAVARLINGITSSRDEFSVETKELCQSFDRRSTHIARLLISLVEKIEAAIAAGREHLNMTMSTIIKEVPDPFMNSILLTKTNLNSEVSVQNQFFYQRLRLSKELTDNWGHYPDNMSVSCYAVKEYYRLIVQFMQKALQQVDSKNAKYNKVWKLNEINRQARCWLNKLSDQTANEIYKKIRDSRLLDSDSSTVQFYSIGLKQAALLELEDSDMFQNGRYLVDDLTNLLSDALPVYALLDGMSGAVHSNKEHHCQLQETDKKLLDQLYEPIKTAITELVETCVLALYGARINTIQLQQKSNSIMSEVEKAINQHFTESGHEAA